MITSLLWVYKKVSKEDKRYICKVLCAECGTVLNESIKLTAAEIIRSWVRIVIATPLFTKKCFKGCTPTYSDCNANINIKIYDIETGKEIDFKTFKEAKK